MEIELDKRKQIEAPNDQPEWDGWPVPIPPQIIDPVFNIGRNPIDDKITDASVKHNHYIYDGK